MYVVQKGDTLTGIAKQFNVPYKALTIWNAAGGKKISPGDKLYIFSDSLKKGQSHEQANP